MATDEAALKEYKDSLKKVERSIKDLENSYLDSKTTLGLVLRGWPEGELKVQADDEDVNGQPVKRVFSEGNYNLDDDIQQQEEV